MELSGSVPVWCTIDPRLIPISHRFCQKCVEGVVKYNRLLSFFLLCVCVISFFEILFLGFLNIKVYVLKFLLDSINLSIQLHIPIHIHIFINGLIFALKLVFMSSSSGGSKIKFPKATSVL